MSLSKQILYLVIVLVGLIFIILVALIIIIAKRKKFQKTPEKENSIRLDSTDDYVDIDDKRSNNEINGYVDVHL